MYFMVAVDLIGAMVTAWVLFRFFGWMPGTRLTTKIIATILIICLWPLFWVLLILAAIDSSGEIQR